MSVVEKRLKKLREKLAEKGIDAALITKRENYVYFSGFTGTSAFLIISQNDAVIITDFRYAEQAKQQAGLYEVEQYHGSLIAALNDVIKKKGINKLGFEEGYLTYEKYSEYKKKLNVSEFSPLGGVLETLRMVKDQDEIEIIKKAVEIADNAFSHIINFIKPGVREIEVAAEIEYFMKRQGAKGASFETIVASGERASMPHGVASEKVINQGDVITLDYGAIYKEYCSDMTRTVFLGDPQPEIKKIYSIVLEAQQKALEGAAAGLTGKEIDFIARDIISKRGYEKNFGHGLGHGVGIEIHEEPRLSMAGSIKMENGMVVTVEPGIYVPGLGGVRIEDMIVINDDKPQILTQSTKDLIVI
ncbi:MAG: Xaa-Pro peptidase family protein [Clostridia bacterium]|nr:Xaa-Pro peptidase family protein [Clostridia bacterium]